MLTSRSISASSLFHRVRSLNLQAFLPLRSLVEHLSRSHHLRELNLTPLVSVDELVPLLSRCTSLTKLTFQIPILSHDQFTTLRFALPLIRYLKALTTTYPPPGQ